MSIEMNAVKILSALAAAPHDAWVNGEELQETTDLEPHAINDAVAILVDANLAEWIKTMGTQPFNFRAVQITPLGRYQYESILSETERDDETVHTTSSDVLKPPVPIGSPYGFHDEDWELVATRKATPDVLYVVLGYQFESTHYDSAELKKNVNRMFTKAVDAYNSRADSVPISLDFRPLAAGYGEHLFNEIARDVISSDIAVFEASDLNPNVMLEMGVSLTWGVRVLPIKLTGRSKPPSDISGQTWADYTNSAGNFEDPEHETKLVAMVDRAMRKKARR